MRLPWRQRATGLLLLPPCSGAGPMRLSAGKRPAAAWRGPMRLPSGQAPRREAAGPLVLPLSAFSFLEPGLRG
eukprot:5054399-Pyramimonas_sp.AAC.1